MGTIFKSFAIGGESRLTVAACACFTLDVKAPNRLLNEQDMWPVIEEAMDKDELFDFGMPKIRGEYLVYGSACAPQPVRGMEVSVSTGSMTKTIAVFGNHYWGLMGAEEPITFTRLAINYQNAFGGPAFPDNPLGKGMIPDVTGKTPIPNIQDPRHLIGSPDDQAQPAGFTAYPMNWPQRQRHMGKVGEQWLLEDWPHFPKDTNWEFFNTAPEDQRLPGFFTGDEKIEITHMHPGKPQLLSSLPALRPRLFIHQREQDREAFREIPCRAETLWLFPDREVGVLLYRGSAIVADEEYEDVLHLYGQWESLAETPRPIEEYGRLFEEEISPPPPPSATAAAAPKPEPAPTPSLPEPALSPEMAALLKESEELKNKAMEMLKKSGLDPEQVVKQFLTAAEPAAASGPGELETAIAVLEKQNAEFMKKHNISAADIEKIMAPRPEAPAKSADELIAEMRRAGIHKPEMETKLKEAEDQTRQALASIADIEKKGAARDAKAAPPASPAGLALTVEEVMDRYGRGESLNSLDLTGLDFSGRKLAGADFSGAVLAGAIFTNGELPQVIFKDAILKNADFSTADLRQANMEQADASGGRFTKAILAGAKMAGGDFTGGDFTDADLSGANAAGTVFEGAVMEGLKAQKISAPQALFARANLADADLMDAVLTDGDFTGANLTHCAFNRSKASGLRLNGASGDNTKFGQALLTGSRADADTILTDARFFIVDLTDACWEGAQLLRAQFVEATLDRADFSKCDLTGAIMVLATAKEAKFMKADLTNANLTGINLFKGSLRKAVLSRTDMKLSNLYGVDFYQAKMLRTNLDGANINKTLLKLRQES